MAEKQSKNSMANVKFETVGRQTSEHRAKSHWLGLINEKLKPEK
jgi:hypothetical protein